MPVNPEETLLAFRERLEAATEPILGADGIPIHWLVKQVTQGYLILDSAGILIEFGFGGVRAEIKHKMSGRTLKQEEAGPLFQKFLDWLAVNIPQTKEWPLEFRDGCPILETDRKVLE